MLGGLAANQGRAGLDAALGHAAHDLRNSLRHILAAGDIVQEEQRPCATADHIVDAHGHAVDTDGIVLVKQLGNAQLGAHAVGTGNQHRLLHTGNRQTEAAAKAAHIVEAPLVAGPCHVFFHELHGLVAGSNVYAGSGVAGRLRILVIHGYSPLYFILCRSSSRCTHRIPAGRWPPECPPMSGTPGWRNAACRRWSGAASCPARWFRPCIHPDG